MRKIFFFLILVPGFSQFTTGTLSASSKGYDVIDDKPSLHYSISMDDPGNHLFHVSLSCRGIIMDTLDFRMPRWMPGYYQMMEYSQYVKDFSAKGGNGEDIPVIKPDKHTWRLICGNNTTITLNYNVFSNIKFVANNYLDTTRAYIVPASTFMYLDRYINIPVCLNVIPYKNWKNIATGLEKLPGYDNIYTASDFDILYDCPLLMGNLEELPSFTISGIKHSFIAWNPGDFDRRAFSAGLERAVRAGIEIIGDIPYKEYTFIGIGPGAGGIEHLNNCTVSFSGNRLDEPDASKKMLKFLAHEYFHHYNVKRIRPVELGPFDYSREARTNLLWVSEGLTVYYEYIMVKRAGIISDTELISSIEDNIFAYENDPGRHVQSLVQSGYQTWSEGPFGNKLPGPDRSISYYDKGPIVGFILDLKIRNETGNGKSLDDVMRYLYNNYYRKLERGFTDAEFMQACEEIAGVSLNEEFEYVYTTKEIDYSKYLSYAGLRISENTDSRTGSRKFTITKIDKPDLLQSSIYDSWAE